ncbi:MAG: DUF4834 family protein [Marinilabilia sp.]
MLLKLIVFLVIGYYVFKVAFRFLLPLFINQQAKKMHQQQEKAHRDSRNKRKEREGKVTIEYNNASSAKKRSNTKDNQEGEYVDFEEIE